MPHGSPGHCSARGSSPKQQHQGRDQAGDKLWKALLFETTLPSLQAALRVVGAEYRAGIMPDLNKVLTYHVASSFLRSVVPCKLEQCRGTAYRSQAPHCASPALCRSSADRTPPEPQAPIHHGATWTSYFLQPTSHRRDLQHGHSRGMHRVKRDTSKAQINCKSHSHHGFRLAIVLFSLMKSRLAPLPSATPQTEVTTAAPATRALANRMVFRFQAGRIYGPGAHLCCRQPLCLRPLPRDPRASCQTLGRRPGKHWAAWASSQHVQQRDT